MREWLKDWLEVSLADDGIRDDSEFYDYIGHMRVVATSLANIQIALKNSPSFLKNSIDDVSDVAETVHALRCEHFKSLVDSDNVVELNANINGKDHINDIYQLDDQAMQLVAETENLINTNGPLKATSILKDLKHTLRKLQSIDSYLLSRTERKIDEEIENEDRDDVEYEILANPPEPLSYRTYSPPPMGIPKIPQQTKYDIHHANNAYTSNQTYTPYYGDSWIQKDNFSYMQGYPPQGNYSKPEQSSSKYVPKHRMTQCGPNKRPVRNLAELMKKARANGKVKKYVARLTLLASISVVGISALAFKSTTHDEPVISTMPPVQETIPATIPISTQIPIPEVTPTSAPMPTQTVSISESNPSAKTNKYSKGTLANSVQHLPDEIISVLANSLRNSMNGRGEFNLKQYGCDVNMDFSTDREYVEHVFNILDFTISNLRKPNCDRFAGAPQIEQLTGDVAKYLIADALNESGKYERTNYSLDDIGFYWTISGGQTDKFDVRTVKIKNGKLVEDQLVGHECHFFGDMKKIISVHCALESAIEGTGPAEIDKLTQRSPHCAFGTQEGTVILENTLEGYEALVNILENEYELKVNTPGKGVKIQYEKDYER